MEVWRVGKTFLIHHSSSMLWEMIVSNVTCMKIEYIRLKHAKWPVWSFKVTISSISEHHVMVILTKGLQHVNKTSGMFHLFP
ncbi:hypothetical protein LDENG_00207170 [Lucifuga dentata]|nr:hypothetical protein LDENG_00207170 [Lucifuga dentata]